MSAGKSGKYISLTTTKSDNQGRRILLLRHGERVDRVFASKSGQAPWFDRCLTYNACEYQRFDLNLPRLCPLRSKDPTYNYDVGDFVSDTPLTLIGEGTAQQLGFHVAHSAWKFTAVYSSPALRCVQTANRFLTGMKNGGVKIDNLLPIKTDPGIFDFTGFQEYEFTGIPTFLSADWLGKRGILLSTKYNPSITREKLEVSEKLQDFQRRVEKALQHILKDASSDISNPASLLISTHAPCVDHIAQHLLKQPARDDERMKSVSNYLKYVATLALEEDPAKPGTWRLIPPPVRTFRYSSTAAQKFQWKKLVDGGGEENEAAV